MPRVSARALRATTIRGGIPREARPARARARVPYPRLGPFGTNQGPARPMRPQNVVKIMTGRAKECAVIAGRGICRPGCGAAAEAPRRAGPSRAVSAEHAQQDKAAQGSALRGADRRRRARSRIPQGEGRGAGGEGRGQAYRGVRSDQLLRFPNSG